MKKRVMKKYIPRNTMYCYKIVGVYEQVGYTVKYCKNFKYLKTVKDFIEIPQKDGSFKRAEVSRPVYICRYTGVTTEEDCCLYDDCKVCEIE